MYDIIYCYTSKQEHLYICDKQSPTTDIKDGLFFIIIVIIFAYSIR